MEPVPLPNGAIILRDDYKSTLETIHAALDVLAEIPAARRLVLLGDVSEPPGRERPIYLALGLRAARVASRLVVIGRGFRRYSAGARRAGMPRSAVVDGGRTVQQAATALQNAATGRRAAAQGPAAARTDRIRMILQGRRVRCDIPFCEYPHDGMRALPDAGTRLGKASRSHVIFAPPVRVVDVLAAWVDGDRAHRQHAFDGRDRSHHRLVNRAVDVDQGVRHLAA
jgi:hypothetical protein